MNIPCINILLSYINIQSLKELIIQSLISIYLHKHKPIHCVFCLDWTLDPWRSWQKPSPERTMTPERQPWWSCFKALNAGCRAGWVIIWLWRFNTFCYLNRWFNTFSHLNNKSSHNRFPSLFEVCFVCQAIHWILSIKNVGAGVTFTSRRKSCSL